MDDPLERTLTLPEPSKTDPAGETDRGPDLADVVAGRFRFVREHAAGNLGRVDVAYDVELNREVALKRIRPDRPDGEEQRRQFLLEGEVTGGLEHPGIVPVYSLGQDERGRPYYAMRFVRGESLRSAIVRLHSETSPGEDPSGWNRELRRLLPRFLSACQAIEYAHGRGIVHRDVKPDNVMLGPYGETLVVDWGLARSIGEGPWKSADGQVIGTPGYMSPEQAAGRGAGPPSDVYNLGATLYAMATGRAPYANLTFDHVRAGQYVPASKVNPHVPAPFEAIVDRAMDRDLALRFPGVKELREGLEAWLLDEPILAHRAAVELFAARAGEAPASHRDAENLARARTELANVLHVLGRNAEAEAEHKAAIAAYRGLMRSRPRAEPLLEGLAINYGRLSLVLRALGREAESLSARDEAMAAYRSVVGDRPEQGHYLDSVTSWAPKQVEPLRPMAEELVESSYAPKAPPASPSPAGPAPGRYVVVGPIGRGGRSQVFEALDQRTGRTVALKKLNASMETDRREAAALLREGRLTARLEHPGVVPVYDYGRDEEGDPYVAMKMLKGRTLKEEIGEAHRAHKWRGTTEGPVPDLFERLIMVCETVAYAHAKGVVHSDLKPNNVHLGDYGETLLLDWGLARVLPATGDAPPILDEEEFLEEEAVSTVNSAATITGTPAYMSPEVFAGDRPGPASDVYALGAIAYVVATNQLPHRGSSIAELMRSVGRGEFPTPRKANPAVPRPLEEIVMRAMRLAPNNRYASPLELAADLRRWLRGQTVVAGRK